MAGERAVRGQQRQEEPTRYGAWREGQRDRARQRGTDEEPEEREENEERDSELGTVGLRLSRRDRERFEREAKAEGVSLSEYLRAVLHDLEDDPELQHKQFLRELATVKSALENYAKANPKDGGFFSYSTSELASGAAKAIGEFAEKFTEEKNSAKPA
jgi:predicted DNA binding CopG/RHH family protein